MRTPALLLSLMLSILTFSALTYAQEEIITTAPAPTPTKHVSLTPEQSRSAASAVWSSMITSAPQQPGSGPIAGDVGLAGSGDSDAGARGNDSGGIKLSQGGMIAIIVVIVVVCVFGIASSVLFYLAKKRSWEVRKKLRSSAKRVATALTPRRTTFPKDVQDPRKAARMTKISQYEGIGNAPFGRRDRDVEKGQPKMKFEMLEPPKGKWGRRTDR